MKRIINYPFKFMHNLYDWTLHFAKTKNSGYALFVVAFIESSFFPVPPDILLIALVASNPKDWWKTALVCTLGSVCGAFLGYAIGKLFFDTVGIAIINFYDFHRAVAIIGEKYANNAFLSIFTGAFTPIPYKALTITFGMFNISLITLFIASILGRGARFFTIALALKFHGAKIQYTIEKYFNILSTIFIILFISGILVFKYLLRQ